MTHVTPFDAKNVQPRANLTTGRAAAMDRIS